MTMQLGDAIHQLDNPDCGTCWRGYPKICDICKKGLIHASHDDVKLRTRCDMCGIPE